MKKVATFFICILFLSFNAFAQEAPEITQRSAYTIGETLEFRSAVLGEKRMLNIYLPGGYANETSKRYPVIYLLDGSADEDFLHIVGLVQFGSFSWIRMIPETIVVGIANIDRKRDFTFPTGNKKDSEDFPTAGGSARFIEMLAKEVRPLVGRTYRTTGPETIIGQSLGGLLAAEILFKRPELFDNYIIISPSLWWDDESLLEYKPKAPVAGKSVYIAVGREGETMERVAAELYEKLKKKKPSASAARLFFQSFPKLDHGDTLHLAVYDAFEKIFRKRAGSGLIDSSEADHAAN